MKGVIFSIFLMFEIVLVAFGSLTEVDLVALPKKANYHMALKLCQEKGLNLVQIQDDATNLLVYNYAVRKKLGRYWIDGNDLATESKWVYSDGTSISYSKWHKGEPNNAGNEDCVEGLYYRNAFWNDINCNQNLAVICYKSQSIRTPSPWEENQIVALPNKANYHAAISLCKEKGMNLVKVQDEETNQFVYNYAVQRKLGKYWMDGNDMATEGKWVYDDGTNVVYSKWPKGEPNNYGNEDCVQGLFYPNGFWNDIKCEENLAVICVKEKTTPKTETETREETVNILITNEKSTYDEALQLCQSLSLKLIRIEDEEVDNVVHKMATKKNLVSYWIDGSDRKQQGTWLDSDGNPLKYKHFGDRKSENSEAAHCISRSIGDNSKWDIVSCDLQNSVLCYEILKKY